MTDSFHDSSCSNGSQKSESLVPPSQISVALLVLCRKLHMLDLLLKARASKSPSPYSWVPGNTPSFSRRLRSTLSRNNHFQPLKQPFCAVFPGKLTLKQNLLLHTCGVPATKAAMASYQEIATTVMGQNPPFGKRF